MDEVQRFLKALRETHPDFEFMFLHGGCYHLHRILKTIWPEGELWYTSRPFGHVWTKIGDRWYDIRGCRKSKPIGARRVSVKTLDRPDKWRHRLALVIDGIAAATIIQRRMRKARRRGR